MTGRSPFLVTLAAVAAFVVSPHVVHADTVPAGILWQLPNDSNACSAAKDADSRTQLRCILTRSHPASLCFANGAPGLACPTIENLRPCSEEETHPPRSAETARQCTLRRFGPHFGALHG